MCVFAKKLYSHHLISPSFLICTYKIAHHFQPSHHICVVQPHMHERYKIFRVYINFAHHIEEYMAGFYIFRYIRVVRSFMYFKNYFTFSSTLSFPLSSPMCRCQASHLPHLKICFTNVNVCGRKTKWLDGWVEKLSILMYIHTYSINLRVYMLTVRICTEYKFSNPYDSTLFILLLLLLLFLLLIFIPFYSVLYLFLSTLTFTILYPFYSVVGSSICLLVQAFVSVLVGKKRKIFHSFLEKLYVWVFHPH